MIALLSFYDMQLKTALCTYHCLVQVSPKGEGGRRQVEEGYVGHFIFLKNFYLKLTFEIFPTHCSQGVVPEALLKERLDVETLDTLGIIPSQKAFNQKYVRTKTKLLCVYDSWHYFLLIYLTLIGSLFFFL